MNEHIKKFEGEAKYEVLHTGFFKTKCDAKIWLHQLEKEEILKHNSHITGLNANSGFLTADVIKNRVIAYNALPLEIRKQIILLDDIDEEIKQEIILN